MRDLDVLLYGASGYTGRLIAAELDRLGARFAVAGRDAARLTALAKSLPSSPDAVAVGVDDARGLESAASRARVVLSAAGPFSALGPPVLRAAVAAGAHFADITGEQSFLRWSLTQDAAAREAGVAVVNALGFDVVPSDLACTMAARAVGGAPDSLDVGIHSRGGVSGGTRRSMAAHAGAGWWFDDGRYRAGPPGRFVREFRFPDKVRTGVFIPWGDVVTAPRSTGAKRVRTFFAFPKKRAHQLHRVWPAVHVVTKLPWTRRRMAARAARAPEGPSAEERRESRFAIVADAARDDVRGRGVVTGRDPYGLTGASAARASVELAAGRVKGRGVLAPGQAFDLPEFAKRIPGFDLAWRSERLK